MDRGSVGQQYFLQACSIYKSLVVGLEQRIYSSITSQRRQKSYELVYHSTTTSYYYVPLTK
jgi:hypothetical protein